jgi:hypothetical protein
MFYYTSGSEILTLLTHCHSKTRQPVNIPCPPCFGEVIDTVSAAGEADGTMGGGHMEPQGLVMLRLGRSVGAQSKSISPFAMTTNKIISNSPPKSKSMSPFYMTTNKSLISDWVGP